MSRTLNQVEAYQFARYQADHQAAEGALEAARDNLHGYQYRLNQDGVSKAELARLRGAGVGPKTIAAELKPYEDAAAEAEAAAQEAEEAEEQADEAETVEDSDS